MANTNFNVYQAQNLKRDVMHALNQLNSALDSAKADGIEVALNAVLITKEPGETLDVPLNRLALLKLEKFQATIDFLREDD